MLWWYLLEAGATFTDAVRGLPFSQPHVVYTAPGHAAPCMHASSALSHSLRLVHLVSVRSWCAVNMQLVGCCSVM